LWVYSHITSYNTFPLPYNANNNTIRAINEFDTIGWTTSYYKIIEVNDVKIWGITYKTEIPNQDFYRSITICQEN
jgi:hypothetical protein